MILSTLSRRACVERKEDSVNYSPSAPWIPSESQFADLLLYVFATMSLRNQALILVLYDGALRREEVTFLRKDHIDERTHTIKIPHELTKNKMPGQIVLSNTTWKVLQDYLKEDRARLVKAYGAEDAGPLFLSESNQNAGQPISKWSITKIFDEIRERTWLAPVDPPQIAASDADPPDGQWSGSVRGKPLRATPIYCQYRNLPPSCRFKACSPGEPHP